MVMGPEALNVGAVIDVFDVFRQICDVVPCEARVK